MQSLMGMNLHFNDQIKVMIRWNHPEQKRCQATQGCSQVTDWPWPHPYKVSEQLGGEDTAKHGPGCVLGVKCWSWENEGKQLSAGVTYLTLWQF